MNRLEDLEDRYQQLLLLVVEMYNLKKTQSLLDEEVVDPLTKKILEQKTSLYEDFITRKNILSEYDEANLWRFEKLFSCCESVISSNVPERTTTVRFNLFDELQRDLQNLIDLNHKGKKLGF